MSTGARVGGVRPPGIPRGSWLRRKTIKSEAARRVREVTDNRTNEPRRLKSCVERWPECETGEYNPSCCRFPKSCSATVYDPGEVSYYDLEP